MENRYSWRSFQNDELQESDVWDLMAERKAKDIGCKTTDSDQPSHRLVSRQLPTAARMIPSRAKNPSREPKLVHHSESAPVKIPDWSKIHTSISKGGESSRNSSIRDQDMYDNGRDGFLNHSSVDSGSEDEDDDDNKLPPHEWLAEKLARNQISSFSVCEGAGRTLKGRDLSRVRHAVLTKTGFI